MLGRAAVQIGEDGVAQRIVHHAVQLSASEIAAALGIGDLVGGILPDLTDDESIRFFLLCGGIQSGDKIVGQLVCDIQPPAGRTEPQPPAHHAVRVAEDKALVVRVALVDLRQGVNAPPRAVFVRPLAEFVPRAVRRVLGLMCAERVIAAAAVEVAAVVAGVVEHAVQHDAHAALCRLAAQRFEVLLVSEQRVDALIVARIIAVVGVRLKDRVEVQRAHMQALKIVELGQHAAQRAAEKVVVQDLPVLIRAVDRKIVPVFVQHARRDALTRRLHRVAVPAEAVGENIIGDALAEPARRPVRRVVDRQLKAVSHAVEHLAASAVAARAEARAVRRVEGEPVPVQTGVRRREGRAVLIPRPGETEPPHRKCFGLPAVDPQRHAGDALLPARIGGELDLHPGRRGAVWLFARERARMEHTLRN